MRKMATAMFWNCQSSRTKCAFHTLQEVGAELKILKASV